MKPRNKENTKSASSQNIKRQRKSDSIGPSNKAIGKKSVAKSNQPSKASNVKVSKKSDVKPNQLSTESNVKEKRSKRKESSSGEDEDMDIQVPSSVYAKWKPLSTSTKNYIGNILDRNMLEVLSNTSNKHFEDVQDILNALTKQLKGKLGPLKAPTSLCKDYREVVSTVKKLKGALQQNMQQQERLAAEIDKQAGLTEIYEEELEKLEQQQNDMDFEELDDTAMVDVDRADAPVLKLPPYSGSLGKHDETNNRLLQELFADISQDTDDTAA